MSALSKVLRGAGHGILMFWCPGCDMAHGLKVGNGTGPYWTWNGDVNKPTFQPSVLVTWDRLSDKAREMNRLFKAEHGHYMTDEELPYDMHHVCHSFVSDGRIQFLGDCTHSLAGQTVDLPGWPADYGIEQ